MDSRDAAQLARDLSPRIAIASHFWMFVVHGGDPAAFLSECKDLAPQVEALVMQPGEMHLVTSARTTVAA
jgi:L-ascorbate metabolism protein UlaG (beta-lactamase superfamily)